MKVKRVLGFLLIIVFVHCYNLASDAGQDLHVLGEHFVKIGNYDAAITEYKRFIFFHADDVRVPRTYMQIGLAYRAHGLWDEAILAMRNAVITALTPEEKSKHQIDLAVTLIASKQYDLGRLELIKVMLRNTSASTYRRSLFLQGVTYIYQYRWEEARDILKGYTTDETLDKLFSETIHQPRKSIVTARVLSGIVPGTGQFYAGNWRGGINALGLNGVLGYAAVNMVLKGNYIDAVSWTYFILRRYYMGNLYRAKTSVEEYNQEKSQRAAENILQRLQEIANTK